MDAVDTDQRIRAMLRRGEQADARALLVAEYDAQVFSLCRGMVRDPIVAEDLKQDAFERAFSSLDDYRGDSSIVAWLLRIARNRCIDHLRRGRRQAVAPIDVDDPPEVDSRLASDLVAGLQRAELALDVLDPEERALVLLHHVHGVDYAELASSFDATEGALRMRMSRALARMRTELEAVDRMKRPRAGSRLTRTALWVALISVVVAVPGYGVYYGVIVPQREAQSALRREIEEMHAEAIAAQEALASAQTSGASAEEVQRLQDELAQARANQAAAASGDTASIIRTRRSVAGPDAGPRIRATGGASGGSGGCMGPLCGLR